MRILGYSWVGVRTEDFGATIRFFVEKLGLAVRWRAEDAEIAHFRLPSGQLFEVFGRNNAGVQTTTCPVVGFEVEDVWAARQELTQVGVEFIALPFLFYPRYLRGLSWPSMSGVCRDQAA